MIGASREYRGQVDQVDAEPFKVVEVLLDAEQVAAVELVRGGRADVDDGIGPLRGLCPVRQRPRIRLFRPREPVGKDLVHHARRRPLGRRRIGDQLEVLGVEGLDRVDPGAVDPQVAAIAHLDQKAVAVHRVLDLDLGLPPVPAVDRRDHRRDGEPRLVIRVRSGAHRGDRAELVRNPDAHAHGLAEGGKLVRDEQRRAVVVRLEQGSFGCHSHDCCTPLGTEDFVWITSARKVLA